MPKRKITLRGMGEGILTDRRSEFLGYAAPVETEEEANEFVRSVKKKHADARHNVFAYILREGAVKRYSDDGEPQGSAGMPVLDVLEKNHLDGVVCVVTRYFGGILLGTGGLVRAYSGAASAAVADAGIVTLGECARLSVRLSYNDNNRVSNDLRRLGANTEDTDFGADVTLTLTVPEEKREALCARLTELTAGRAVISYLGSVLAPTDADA